MRARTVWWWHFAGWILFLVCAVLFLIASARDGDMLTIAASVVFLVACVVFLIPMLRTFPPRG